MGWGGRAVSEGCGVTESVEQAPALTEMPWRLAQKETVTNGNNTTFHGEARAGPWSGLRVTQSWLCVWALPGAGSRGLPLCSLDLPQGVSDPH